MTQCTAAIAQKLPKVQASSVRAPANIKIDGKLTEWNDRFQAHNLGNHLYYTLANDDDNLYLSLQTDDVFGDQKVFKGGLTFTIIPIEKSAERVAITYPVISMKNRGEMAKGEGGNVVVHHVPRADTLGKKARIDSMMAFSNDKIPKAYKEIHIKGMSDIDTLLSIYNTDGIKVGANFNRKLRYTYELAIPLKYLASAVSDTKSIKYNIKLRTLPILRSPRPSGLVVNITAPQPAYRPPSIDDLFRYEDSDFSGTYTLAPKP
ncbi:hypothetical protein GCM10028827_42790 [Mucilaginibacter myungsuensis]